MRETETHTQAYDHTKLLQMMKCFIARHTRESIKISEKNDDDFFFRTLFSSKVIIVNNISPLLFSVSSLYIARLIALFSYILLLLHATHNCDNGWETRSVEAKKNERDEWKWVSFFKSVLMTVKSKFVCLH